MVAWSIAAVDLAIFRFFFPVYSHNGKLQISRVFDISIDPGQSKWPQIGVWLQSKPFLQKKWMGLQSRAFLLVHMGLNVKNVVKTLPFQKVQKYGGNRPRRHMCIYKAGN